MHAVGWLTQRDVMDFHLIEKHCVAVSSSAIQPANSYQPRKNNHQDEGKLLPRVKITTIDVIFSALHAPEMMRYGCRELG